jgi:hypothetical protein
MRAAQSSFVNNCERAEQPGSCSFVAATKNVNDQYVTRTGKLPCDKMCPS